MKERFIIFEVDGNSYHLTMIQKGIQSYLESCSQPVSFLPLGLAEIKQLSLESDNVEIGVIGWFRSNTRTRYLQENKIPYINLFECAEMSNCGCDIAFQNEGGLAAEFFIKELKLKNLAFVGLDGVASSQRRMQEFRAKAKEHDLEVDCVYERLSEVGPYVEMHENKFAEARQKIHDWLFHVGKPVGIFCSNDRIALNLLFRSERCGFSVPDEISILGVGSIHGADQAGVGSISIVHLDHVQQGYTSARIMADYLIHRKSPSTPIRLKPDGIVHRSTTTRLAIGDDVIREAISLIQRTNDVTVESLCDMLHISRRALERRFRSVTNMTVARAIDFERFNKAKLLMKNRKYNYEAIAGLAGYSDVKQMRRSFQRLTQMNPRQFRSVCAPPEK